MRTCTLCVTLCTVVFVLFCHTVDLCISSFKHRLGQSFTLYVWCSTFGFAFTLNIDVYASCIRGME